jgi:arginine-tRNA-protein transferase
MGSCLGRHTSAAAAATTNNAGTGRRAPPHLKLDNDEINELEESLPIVPPHELRNLISVQLYDDPNPPQCPYCEAPGSDRSDMMICNSQFVPYDVCELLMERGWWRTGNVFFRPQIENICCPSFAIRMPPAEYELNKNHRRILNKWKDFLLHGHPEWENRQQQGSMPPLEEKPSSLEDSHVQVDTLIDLSEPLETPSKVKKVVKPGNGPDPFKPPCKKSKVRRAEKLQAKRACNESLQEIASPVKEPVKKKSLFEVLQEHEDELSRATPKHVLEMKVVSVKDDDSMRTSLREFFHLYNSFQDAVHPGKSKFKTARDLHWGFVNSPLMWSQSKPWGTFHMKYYLDGELVMLSVVDILPHYFVSIYFIYNPAIRFLQPGIYTCLREIAYIQQLQKLHPELEYYNLGFFNDYSQKISYKKQFKPTEILCPITNTYVPLTKVLPLLDETRFCRFSDEDVPSRPEEDKLNVDSVIVLDVNSLKGRYYKDLPNSLKVFFKPILQHYMRNTGEDVMARMFISK